MGLLSRIGQRALGGMGHGAATGAVGGGASSLLAGGDFGDFASGALGGAIQGGLAGGVLRGIAPGGAQMPRLLGGFWGADNGSEQMAIRLANQIKQENPSVSDEQALDAARKLINARMAQSMGLGQ